MICSTLNRNAKSFAMAIVGAEWVMRWLPKGTHDWRKFITPEELVALGISVAVRCDPCIAYHAKAAVKAGATEAEVAETLGLAVYMGAGPSAMYAAKALEAVRQFGVAGGDKPA